MWDACKLHGTALPTSPTAQITDDGIAANPAYECFGPFIDQAAVTARSYGNRGHILR